MIITSTQNPRVKEALKLRDRRDRDKAGLFLIEGYRELLRAEESALALQELFICPELFLGTNERALIDRITARGAEVIPCSDRVFQKLSYRDRPDGLLGIARRTEKGLTDLTLPANPLIVVAEAIEKPGNLGTILRSSDAAGASALIVADRCTDVYNPNVVRASCGTLFTVPVAEADSRSAIRWLQDNNIAILAATPSADTCHYDVDLRGPVAIAVGCEQLGLSSHWMEEADILVRLPMRGRADSLNVAMATTILLYEALRQRSV